METIEKEKCHFSFICECITINNQFAVIRRKNKEKKKFRYRNIILEDGRAVIYGQDNNIYCCPLEQFEIIC